MCSSGASKKGTFPCLERRESGKKLTAGEAVASSFAKAAKVPSRRVPPFPLAGCKRKRRIRGARVNQATLKLVGANLGADEVFEPSLHQGPPLQPSVEQEEREKWVAKAFGVPGSQANGHEFTGRQPASVF